MKKITLLAPSHTLPAEGDDDRPIPAQADSTESLNDLLDFYAAAVEYQGIDFVLDEEENAYFSDNPDSVFLQCIDVRSDDGTTPMLDPRMAFCSVSLPDELPATDGKDEDLEPVIDALSDSLRTASSAFSGTPVPLLCRRRSSEDSHETLRCLGLLLAEDDDLDVLQGTANASGGRLGIVLDEGDIEGRGLREVMASAAVAALMLGSATEADAGLFFKKDRTEEISANTRKASKSKRTLRAPQQKMAAKVDRDVLAKANGSNTHIIVDISQQKAFVFVGGEVGVETPVSTARPGKHTPRGEFTITEKIRSGKTSTIYGCEMPCWMRLNQSAYGLHVGDLPGYPASAGCVRLPSNIAPIIFEHAGSGTVVKIVDSLDMALLASR